MDIWKFHVKCLRKNIRVPDKNVSDAEKFAKYLNWI